MASTSITPTHIAEAINEIHELYREAAREAEGELSRLRRKIALMTVQRLRHELHAWSTDNTVPPQARTAARHALNGLDLSHPLA